MADEEEETLLTNRGYFTFSALPVSFETSN
jgi:hypothetical protein